LPLCCALLPGLGENGGLLAFVGAIQPRPASKEVVVTFFGSIAFFFVVVFIVFATSPS
jgi:hypothetical protein